MTGRPAPQIDALAVPPRLVLPLETPRFRFSDVRVQDGQTVAAGAVLAADTANFGVPLIAPRGGVVRLGQTPGHVVLEDVTPDPPQAVAAGQAQEARPPCERCDRLLRLGAWSYFADAHTGGLPDPQVAPRAVLVSTLRLEPFEARGDVLLARSLEAFLRGLEQVQSLLEYQPTYLVVPKVESSLANRIHESLRGLAWIQSVTVPLRYPFDRFAVLARGMGLMKDAGPPVWGLRVEGVLAVEQALGRGVPISSRVITLGGPGVKRPRHIEALPGTPLETLLAGETIDEPVRVITGGALTGRQTDPAATGLDPDCAGLTLVPETVPREVLSFVRPGLDRKSYSRTFLGSLLGGEGGRTTALQGEPRACIACGLCAEVCPAGILPHVIHRALYRKDIDAADRLRVDLCVRCGLCAYVCPSKLELLREFIEAQDTLRAERLEAEGARA
jgi:Na+-transporting NADH:ubiquinone oxidoreductase subunit A